MWSILELRILEFEHVGRLSHHFSHNTWIGARNHQNVAHKYTTHNCRTKYQGQRNTFTHLYKCSNSHNPILGTSKLYHYKTTHVHIHMCAQLQILKRFGICTFLGYKFVGESHPSCVAIDVHTLATSAYFHQCSKTLSRVTCRLELCKTVIPQVWEAGMYPLCMRCTMRNDFYWPHAFMLRNCPWFFMLCHILL